MIPERRLPVFRDIASQKPDFPGTNASVRLVKRDFARSQTLHLTPHERNSALQRLENIEAMPGLAVLGHNALRSGGLSPLGLFGIGGILMFGHVMYRSLRRSLLLIKSPPPPPHGREVRTQGEAALGTALSLDESHPAQVWRSPIMPEKRPVADVPADSGQEEVSVLFYLLGNLPFDQYLALQRRFVYELGAETRSRIPVLICEHPPLITVGRRGSRAHIKLSGEQLRWRQLAVRWVSRGGGCVLHGPGQLAIYPLVPLANLGWSLGDYLRRLRQGLQATLQSLAISSRLGEHDWGLWGRSGQLAAVGFSVRNDITQYGVYLNVNPSMSSHHYLRVPGEPNGSRRRGNQIGCLVAEKSQGVKMTDVRAALMEHLSAAWGANGYHVLSGHPFLEKTPPSTRGTNARAS